MYIIFLGIKDYKRERLLEMEILIHPASNLLSDNYRQWKAPLSPNSVKLLMPIRNAEEHNKNWTMQDKHWVFPFSPVPQELNAIRACGKMSALFPCNVQRRIAQLLCCKISRYFESNYSIDHVFWAGITTLTKGFLVRHSWMFYVTLL